MQFRGGLNELMRQASRLQRRIDQRREELKSQEFEAAVGGDRVKVVVNGDNEVLRLVVDPKLVEEEGLEMMQDLVIAATNAALAKARDTIQAEIDKVSGGVKLPGMV